ncbi:MAG: helicase-related protein [Gemmatimonadales bacterium]
MNRFHDLRDRYLPPDPDEYRRGEPATGRIIVIAPTRAACETIELALQLDIATVLQREHGKEIEDLAGRRVGFGIVAGTGTGKTLAIRRIATEVLGCALKIGVVNREREATPETPTWNVVVVTTGIARRWFQDDLICRQDTLVVDEIHQTSAELELCLALGKRVGCRFVWLSATVDPTFYRQYLDSAEVLETRAFDPKMAARVMTRAESPFEFLDERFVRRVAKDKRGVAVFLPTRAEVEQLAAELGRKWHNLTTAFYHGGEPIRIIRPFLDGTAKRPFILAMTQAGQSALNIHGLDTVVIYDANYEVIIDRGRNILTRRHLGANAILQMAGRVHGRVENGEVYILTDRQLEFDKLLPTAPKFQLAGDSERVALTAAALRIDLAELDLPVPLDRRAYGEALDLLTSRGLVENGALTAYGRDVEAMPVDRPFAELLVQAENELVPFLAVAANIDSLHRFTRDEHDLRNLIVAGSDHLTAYNIVAEAINRFGYVQEVHGLPRHLLHEEIVPWAEERGVLLKALEDAALGTAAVYRTLDCQLPERMPRVCPSVERAFRQLVARVMPFDLMMDGELANGEPVRLSRSSVCNRYSAVAGSVSYFADRFGTPRAAIEGSNVPLKLIRQYASRRNPIVEFTGRHRPGLFLSHRTEYFGFELDSEREPIKGVFPRRYAEQCRAVLAEAVIAGETPHRCQAKITHVVRQLEEYWRRSGGTVPIAHRETARRAIEMQLQDVKSWKSFLAADLELDLDAIIPPEQRESLDRLPAFARILGHRMPLRYDLQGDSGVIRIRLKESQARRLRARDVPKLDRPVYFSITRGKREIARAGSFDELSDLLKRLPARRERRGRSRR